MTETGPPFHLIKRSNAVEDSFDTHRAVAGVPTALHRARSPVLSEVEGETGHSAQVFEKRLDTYLEATLNSHIVKTCRPVEAMFLAIDQHAKRPTDQQTNRLTDYFQEIRWRIPNPWPCVSPAPSIN